MKSLATSFLLYLSLLLDDLAVGAVRIPITGERVSRRRWSRVGSLGRRASLTSNLQDASDIEYYTNVTMGGQEFKVLIDTGSSDLWVAGSVPGAQSTGKTASVDYAIGAANGSILTATTVFDGYTIDNQAFIEVSVDSSHPTGQGIIGLGPNSASEVYAQINNESGDNVLNRIFRQNTSTPNYLTILLGRTYDAASPFQGEITVGRVVPEYENITSQPHLSVTQDQDANDQHYQVLVDKNGIIGPDGSPIQATSVVEGLDQLIAVFDSGFSLPQVPATVSNAIYSRVPGANFTYMSNVGNVWTLPCDVELNITFMFGGVSFPINPLDTNLGSLTMKNANGDTVCAGAFQPITTAASSNFDMILGMAFLRNAYLLVNMGDFIDGSSSQTAPPYVQLLPLTTQAGGHADFVQERLGGVDNTSSFHLLPASVPNTDSGGTSSSNESWQEKIKPYLPYIIAGSVAVGILLIVAFSYCLTSRRHRPYQSLHDPAPVGLHHEQPPFPRYDRPYRRY